MRPQAGDLINGKYRLVRLIGDGGMGSVFEARHEYLNTTVALKFLHPELAKRPGLVARFLREARVSASIKSPHIAHVTDVDQASDGVAYLVMELLEGKSLMTVLGKGNKLPLDVALDYTLQILAGLEAAHAVGVVHRDLKPDNVFVVSTPQGPLVKLLDFGIAKLRNSKEFQVALTRPGVMMGTPEYMAPEQVFAAEAVDSRADVYSVGAMLYEMLAGNRPAHGEDATQIAAFIMGGKVTRLDHANPIVPAKLADVVHRAMAAAPEGRFTSALELRDALLPFCGSLSLAGRLAATPSPGSGVAPTWPPDEKPAATPTTQTAEANARPHGSTEAAAPWVPAKTAGAPTPGAPQTPGPAGPYGTAYAATDYSPGYGPAGFASYGVPPTVGRPDAVSRTPGRARGPRRLSVWLLVVMIGLAIGIVVVAFAMGETTDRKRTTPVATPAHPTATTPAATAASTVAPRATATSIAPPVQPPKETPTAVANRPASKPATAADAGAADAPAPQVGFPNIPGLPFPLPSGIPFPSTLPLPIPLPSGFPPFGLPGFPQPAPAPSQ